MKNNSTNRKLKILIVDDQDLIHQSLTKDLNQNQDFQVEATSRLSDLTQKGEQYDVIALDMKFSGELHAGLTELAEFRDSAKKEVKVIIISNHVEKFMIDKAIELKAVAYIEKDEHVRKNLQAVLQDIFEGRDEDFVEWSSKAVRKLMVADDEIDSNKKLMKKFEPFKEKVLRHKAEGYTSMEVAAIIDPNEELKITYMDIDTFLKTMARRWKIRNDKAAIVAKAIQNGTIHVKDLTFPDK